MQLTNGVPADPLAITGGSKAVASNPSGNCVEVAELRGGAIAVPTPASPLAAGPRLRARGWSRPFLAGVQDRRTSTTLASGTDRLRKRRAGHRAGATRVR